MALGAALGAAGAGILGGLLGNQAAGRARKDAERVLDADRAAWEALALPEYENINYEDFLYNTNLMPILQGESQMAGIETDPRFRDAEMDALAQLAELSEGGMNLGDRVAMQEAQDAINAQEQANQEAIMMNMAERGMGGAGQELAQRLVSQQGAADRMGAFGAQQAASAQQRALDAIAQRGALGGQMQARDFSQQAQQAQAQDAINQFNALASQNMQQANRAAQQANVDRRLQGAQQGNLMAQQAYQDQLAKQQGISGTAAARAGVTAGRGQQQANMYGGIGSAIGQGLGAYFGDKK